MHKQVNFKQKLSLNMQISEIIFEFLAQNGLNEVVQLGIPKKTRLTIEFF